MYLQTRNSPLNFGSHLDPCPPDSDCGSGLIHLGGGMRSASVLVAERGLTSLVGDGEYRSMLSAYISGLVRNMP